MIMGLDERNICITICEMHVKNDEYIHPVYRYVYIIYIFDVKPVINMHTEKRRVNLLTANILVGMFDCLVLRKPTKLFLFLFISVFNLQIRVILKYKRKTKQTRGHGHNPKKPQLQCESQPFSGN